MTPYDFLLETYETERFKTLTVWSEFADAELQYRPAPLSRTPHEHMVHQCVSEDTWMLKMLGIDSGLPALPATETRLGFLRHYAQASEHRLSLLRQQSEEWFSALTTFFDVPRSRSWVLLRRLTHSAHHRAQLTVYLRLLGHSLYSTYGPTADTGGLFRVTRQSSTAIRQSTSCSPPKPREDGFLRFPGLGWLPPRNGPARPKLLEGPESHTTRRAIRFDAGAQWQ